MQINFLVTPDILSDAFHQFGKTVLGVDLSTRQPKAPNFLANLSLLKTSASFDPSNPGSLLRHLSYSVLVKDSAASISQIKAESCLHTLSLGDALDGERLLLLTGNLVELRSEVINGCSEIADPHYRDFTTKLLLRLDEQGLGSLFQHYARRIKPNTKTLILVPENKNAT